jgi:hypothetical protein
MGQETREQEDLCYFRSSDRMRPAEHLLDLAVAVRSSVVLTLPHDLDASFGDGILVFAVAAPARAVVSGARVESSARAGIASFGGTVVIGASTLECNPIRLDLESSE